jgi:murein DD-endopeptidase MepM/ murein hydrolase activator NlpD
MTGARGTVPRTIGLALLVQWALWLVGPSSGFTEPKPQAVQKRAAAGKFQKSVVPGRRERCVHVVGRGDSLARLAARYRTTRQALMTTNRLTTADRLRVGQRLHVATCPRAPEPRQDEPEVTSVTTAATELLARVGPRRVLTRLFLAFPEFARDGAAFQWPVDGAVASAFGRRHRGWHAGIDIPADMGTPIRAAAAGTVIVSGWERAYGNVVKIQHTDGFLTVYAHNLENLVEVGDTVPAGAIIATVGRSGHASANHLHFEIRQEGVAYNPLHLLEARDTTVMASIETATAAATGADDEDRE